MNEKRYRWWCCVLLWLFVAGVSAQTDTISLRKNVRYAAYNERDRWFVSGGAGMQSLFGGEDMSSGITGGINPFLKLSAGRWFSHVSAIRVGVDAGYVKDDVQNYPMVGFRADYMADLISMFRYKEFRRVDLIGFLGMGYDYVASRPIDPFAGLLSLNFGVQAGYNISQQISIFAEPSVKFTSDLFDGDIKSKKRFIGNVTLGVTYRFGSGRFRQFIPDENNVIDIKQLTDNVSELQRLVAEKKGSGFTGSQNQIPDNSALFTDTNMHRTYYSDHFRDNIFISAGVSGGAILGSEGALTNVVPGVNLAAGKWISPLWGAQLAVNYGRAGEFTTHYGSVTGEFLMDLSSACAGYNKNRKFSVVPLAGLGWLASKREGDFTGSMVFTAGLQGRFAISSGIDVFAEGRGLVIADHIFRGTNGECSHGIVSLQLGAAYKFGGRKFKIYDFVKEEQAKELNARINMLREELTALNAEDEKSDTLKIDSLPDNALINDEDGRLYVKIKFDTFSSYLDQSQLQNVNHIGEWLGREKQFTIKVIPFSDSSNNRKVDEILRMRRANAIIEILTGKFDIDPDRIGIAMPEKMGYKDEDDNSTIILFIPVD